MFLRNPGGGELEHSGTDWGAAIGTPIYAAAPGTVIAVTSDWSSEDMNSETLAGTAGNYVKIRHTLEGTQTFWTSYQHMSSVVVELNAIVEAGELIGYVGNTGRSSGPHLHFEMRLVDCYDGYGETANPLGTCSTDATRYIVDQEGMTNCEETGNLGPILSGDFACPVENPERACISQTSDGSGSHSLPAISPQNATDIYAPNQRIFAPVAGTVTKIRTPIDTVSAFGPDICDYIRLPDHNPSNDYDPNNPDPDERGINYQVINAMGMTETSPGSGIYQAGSSRYDARIDDEGDYFYDGGFVVHITDDVGNLWRLVHVKDIQVSEGDEVRPGDPIGRVYDGTMEGEWADYSVKPNDGSGCFSVSIAHLHFATISSNAVNSTNYSGNTIDSTPWVQEHCGITSTCPYGR